MITPVDIVKFAVRDVIGLDISKEDKKEYLAVIFKAVAEGLAKGAVSEAK